MKKLLYPILAVLVAIAPTLRAQTTPTPTPVPTWAQTYGVGTYDKYGNPSSDYSGFHDTSEYGTTGIDSATAIAPMPDGGVVVAGQLGLFKLQYGGGTSSALVRYARDGAIVWQQVLRLNDDTANNVGRSVKPHISRMRTDRAGNVFICGETGYSPSTGADSPFVAKFSPDGALVWQNSLNSIIERDIVYEAPRDQPYGVAEYGTMDLTSDGGVVVGSAVYSSGNGHTDPIIVKFNADGSVGMHRIYANSNQYSGVLSVCERQGGNGFAVLLNSNYPTPGQVLMLTDVNGEPVLQRSFNRDRTAVDATFVTRGADGGYFLLGNSGYGAEVRKLGADLTPIWQKSITRYVAGNGLALTGTLVPTADGGCILGGQIAEASYKNPGNGSSSTLMLTLDAGGVLRSAHLLGGPANGETNPVYAITADGTPALAASTYSYQVDIEKNHADWWVVKTDINGKVAGFLGTMTDAPLDIFTQADSTETAGAIVNDYGPGLANEVSATTTSLPHLVQEDLGTEIGINKPTVKTQTTTPIPPPVHGGLSGITFSVNESTDPVLGLADTVLRFRSVQNGRAAGVNVRVQSSTDKGATWTDLTDGASGRMTFVARLGAYVLDSTNYPTTNNVYFRSTAKAGGYGEKSSAPVGPFDLTSSKPHLGGPLLFITTNGEVNAIRFGVKQSSIPSGVAVRIQTSQTPATESSWTDAPIGSSGNMDPDTTTPDPTQFYLGTDDYPASAGDYFRAIANAPGYIDGISFPYGPFTFISDPPANVTIKVNGANNSPNDIDGGYLLPSGTFNMQANAASGRLIKRLTLLFDGNTIGHFDDGATTGSLDYTTNIPGDHIIEAYATDDLGVTGAAAPIHVRILPAAPGNTFKMTKSGDWNEASNWVDIQGNAGVPGPRDFAIVSTFSPTLSTDVTVNAMSLNGGTFSGAHTITVTGFCTIADGTIKSNLTIPAGSTCELLNDKDIALTGRLTYAGTMRLHGKGGIGGIKSTAARAMSAGAINNGFFDFVGGIINGLGKFIADVASGGRRGSKASPAANTPNVPEKRTIAAAQVNIAAGSIIAAPAPAALISQDGGGIVSHDSGGLISQDGGGLISQDGGGLVASGGGNLVASGGGNLVASGGGNLISQDGGGLVASGGGNLVATGGGNLVASGGGNLVASGGGNALAFSSTSAASAEAATAPAAISVSGGELNLSGFSIFGNLSIDGGLLSGTGMIVGDLNNNRGFVSPGHSAGTLAVTGNFAQGGDGTLIVENGGPSAGQFDALLIAGAASLGGKLDVKLTNGYVPDVADTFNPIGYSSVSGSFASVSGNAQLTFNSTGAVATVNPAVAGPKSGQPLNIATRLSLQGGDNGLIGGFIISGPGNSTKKVLIRAIGPSLAKFGVPGVLADPLLELHDGSGALLTSNDNWQSGDTSQIPVNFQPGDPKESVIVATLAPGAYTAVLKGADGGIGVGLAEIYDFDPASAAQLGNIATRGLVQTGDNVMIGGFIIGGQDAANPAAGEPAKVLVRVTGPTLKKFGITGQLDDPTLELHDGSGNLISSNDNWRETQESEVKATTLQPADEREPAIVATLVPGNYTAVVRGAGDTTGIAVVEAYNLQ